MEENFVRLTKLLGDPARAVMLWSLLDGRAYTAGELALCADLSAPATSNHLTKLVGVGLLRVERQGRHKYFTLATPQIASVIESMGALLVSPSGHQPSRSAGQHGVLYCRKCYDHLAGFVGVAITESLVDQDLLRRQEHLFIVTEAGKSWLNKLGIDLHALINKRRPLARPCLDWSERKVHLGGSLGQALLEKLIDLDWLRLTQHSRAVVVTGKGRQHLGEQLAVWLD